MIHCRSYAKCQPVECVLRALKKRQVSILETGAELQRVLFMVF
jgi:hypothetical protein